MSLRSLRLASMSSISRVRPSASNRFEGLKIFEVGLVEIGDRDRLQLQTVLRQRFGGIGLDARDIVAALLVHLLHRHLGGDRADRGNELAESRVWSCSGSMVRRPSVAAAIETASRVGWTRT